MKSLLTPTPKANTVNEDANALQCLHHLRDARLVEISWEFHYHSEATEIVRFSVNGNGVNLVLEEMRDVSSIQKQPATFSTCMRLNSWMDPSILHLLTGLQQ